MGEAIEAFHVEIPQPSLDDLRRRLEQGRYPTPLPGAGWDYGTDHDTLRELITYWRDEYDWRATEARLNQFDQATTEIDGQQIHFLHVRSPEPDALALVLTHGWPGSLVEFLDVIGPLSDPRAVGGDPGDAFHLVIPSLPGYGFSGPTYERGWDPGRIARGWAQLMGRLGYPRYVAQGGDWGSFVTSQLARSDPDHVAGIHLNMIAPNPGGDDPSTFTEAEQSDMAAFVHYLDDESGYQRIQSTRPHTLGFALEDSPVGLCAWIVEKFRAWSDGDGELSRSFTNDQLLDNVMLYWLTGTATSSVRLYYEFDKALRAGRLDLGSRIETPTAYARYPKEIMRTSRRWAERQYHLVHYADLPRGGHFAAMEQPALFVDDLRAAFRLVR